jgi:UDP-N-acetylmuramoylalanine--D-glutamate ligase
VRERVSGAFYENGALYFGKEKILSVAELPMGGLHNVQNALAVIACAKIMGVKTADIVAALTDFKGIKHRIERIGEVNGVTYIDDSKGTNVDATMKAIEAMKTDTILLLGGKNKGYDYGKLFAVLSNTRVKHAVLYGENRFALLKSAREYSFENFTLCDSFEFAVRIAALKAKEGQTVLLSPASASFDEFASYEERGDKFVEIVGLLSPKREEIEERTEENPVETEREEIAGEEGGVCGEFDTLRTAEDEEAE